jgi:hypothetical protein
MKVLFPEHSLLLRLQDSAALYKGVWTLEDQGSGLVRASHLTYCSADQPGFVIEQRYFPAHGQAGRFVNHLLLHGWSICESTPDGHLRLGR